MHAFFVTGTDTGVGKTFFCSRFVRALRSAGRNAVGMKPFCCGDRDDALRLHEAAGGVVELDRINPVWLQVPAAPYAACLVENRLLDADGARDGFSVLMRSHEWVVVEGVGGWRVPLTAEWCSSDFAAELGLPVLVVSANKLGTLNHTQLTVDAILARGLPCLGVILNDVHADATCPASVTNAGILEQLLPVPLLGQISHQAEELPEPMVQRIVRRLSEVQTTRSPDPQHPRRDSGA